MEPANTFRIMIATDVHLGCYGNDPVRSEDSFNSFEETLQNCVRHKADFLLLGGDLFHHSRPAQPVIFKCLRMLREYCLGSKPAEFEIVSDQKVNFAEQVSNIDDPNFKISLPIFSIHGNHDDPTGLENLSVMNIVSKANYINYFGKATDISRIVIHPILLEKGHTKIALYGLGSIKDERLHRLFLDRKVKFARPVSDREEWFNIFVIHQNRYKHSYSQLNYIPETFIPSFIHLVVWAHEHECLMELHNASDFKIIQPGSTTRTSLSKNEVADKHIGMLLIEKQNCKLNPIKLKTCRPFKLDEIDLKTIFPSERETTLVEIEDVLTKRVQKMIEDIANELNLSEEELCQKSNLPLIRIRVEHSGFEVLNASAFGKKFLGKVANPIDILMFFKKNAGPRERPYNELKQKQELDLGEIPNLILKQIENSKTKPSLLSTLGFLKSLKKFVEKSEHSAIDQFVEKSINFARRKLEEDGVVVESKEDIIKRMKSISVMREAESEIERRCSGISEKKEKIGKKKCDNKRKERMGEQKILPKKVKKAKNSKNEENVENESYFPEKEREFENLGKIAKLAGKDGIEDFFANIEREMAL